MPSFRTGYGETVPDFVLAAGRGTSPERLAAGVGMRRG